MVFLVIIIRNARIFPLKSHGNTLSIHPESSGTSGEVGLLGISSCDSVNYLASLGVHGMQFSLTARRPAKAKRHRTLLRCKLLKVADFEWRDVERSELKKTMNVINLER